MISMPCIVWVIPNAKAKLRAGSINCERSELPTTARRLQRTLYVTARQIPGDFVLAHVPTCQHEDLVRGHHFVHEGVRKPVQERPPHSAIVAHDRVHPWIESEEGVWRQARR